MEAKDVQVPSAVKLLVSVEDYCRIMDFTEPDAEGETESYSVRFEVAKDYELERFFNTKEAADSFVDLLKDCTGTKVNSDPSLVKESL